MSDSFGAFTPVNHSPIFCISEVQWSPLPRWALWRRRLLPRWGSLFCAEASPSHCRADGRHQRETVRQGWGKGASKETEQRGKRKAYKTRTEGLLRNKSEKRARKTWQSTRTKCSLKRPNIPVYILNNLLKSTAHSWGTWPLLAAVE